MHQRRSHPKICELINQPFYEGKLVSNFYSKGVNFIGQWPFRDRSVVYLPLKESIVNFSKGGSRYNVESQRYIIKLLRKYAQLQHIPEIGIICPYRAQVRLLQKELVKDFHKGFVNKVKVGTIHSFQGSESDIIIFDLLENMVSGAGRLYQHDTGRRLINVGISRARYKIIFVGNLDVFTEGKGYNNIDLPVRRIVNEIRKCEVRSFD